MTNFAVTKAIADFLQTRLNKCSFFAITLDYKLVVIIIIMIYDITFKKIAGEYLKKLLNSLCKLLHVNV